MLTTREQRLRRRARARVLQAMYAWEATGRESLPAVADRLWSDLSLGSEARAFAEPIVRTIAHRAGEIDELLRDVTANWRLDRLGAVERALLRLGVAELVRGEVPPRAVIQEAVHLADRYATPDSARFVNGVLDAVARRLGRL